jgi:hypothetical protein
VCILIELLRHRGVEIGVSRCMVVFFLLMIHYSYIPTCTKPGYWRSINHTLLNHCGVRCEALSVGLSTLRLVHVIVVVSW